MSTRADEAVRTHSTDSAAGRERPERRAGERLDAPAACGAGGGWGRRDVLAAERTFLAWLRTCLALIAAGTALGALPRLPLPELRLLLAVACLLLAGWLAIAACGRWEAVRRAAVRGPGGFAGNPAAVATAAVVLVAASLAGISAARVVLDHAGHYQGQGSGRRRCVMWSASCLGPMERRPNTSPSDYVVVRHTMAGRAGPEPGTRPRRPGGAYGHRRSAHHSPLRPNLPPLAAARLGAGAPGADTQAARRLEAGRPDGLLRRLHGATGRQHRHPDLPGARC
ncbi:DUF202 domain-containing protein [Phaeacidiphilus oryzae]|uniref:DUF202 domain-containing protein n=1 Tax=Phaeacidiphilus oryzae TaxID=348818 RepID=UPI000A07B7E0|nr:DUF202 domain-containing protein [Phaeacidiphilus oryzae]